MSGFVGVRPSGESNIPEYPLARLYTRAEYDAIVDKSGLGLIAVQDNNDSFLSGRLYNCNMIGVNAFAYRSGGGGSLTYTFAQDYDCVSAVFEMMSGSSPLNYSTSVSNTEVHYNKSSNYSCNFRRGIVILHDVRVGDTFSLSIANNFPQSYLLFIAMDIRGIETHEFTQTPSSTMRFLEPHSTLSMIKWSHGGQYNSPRPTFSGIESASRVRGVYYWGTSLSDTHATASLEHWLLTGVTDGATITTGTSTINDILIFEGNILTVT